MRPFQRRIAFMFKLIQSFLFTIVADSSDYAGRCRLWSGGEHSRADESPASVGYRLRQPNPLPLPLLPRYNSRVTRSAGGGSTIVVVDVLVWMRPKAINRCGQSRPPTSAKVLTLGAARNVMAGITRVWMVLTIRLTKTGFEGVMGAAGKDPSAILAILKGSTNPDHNFSSAMNDQALTDIALFLNKYLMDTAELIEGR